MYHDDFLYAVLVILILIFLEVFANCLNVGMRANETEVYRKLGMQLASERASLWRREVTARLRR